MVLQHSPGQQRPIVDLLVAMIAVPILILCALQLEKHMQERWEENAETRWLVFGLGISMLFISVLICGYVTHRMGVCIWTGPLEATSGANSSDLHYVNSQNDILRYVDTLPPSYDSVVNCDIPPPTYDCIVNLEQNKKQEASSKAEPPQEITSLHI